ncbi:MAG: hypothetical protein QOD24_1699 [Solirubrobacteraceae bacterium]|nr:hypothetical protein [Solirubrobacteraceae bacterium]
MNSPLKRDDGGGGGGGGGAAADDAPRVGVPKLSRPSEPVTREPLPELLVFLRRVVVRGLRVTTGRCTTGAGVSRFAGGGAAVFAACGGGLWCLCSITGSATAPMHAVVTAALPQMTTAFAPIPARMPVEVAAPPAPAPAAAVPVAPAATASPWLPMLGRTSCRRDQRRSASAGAGSGSAAMSFRLRYS